MNELWFKTNELIKKAFDLWDIKDWNLDDVDPVVKLLIAACANESISIDKRIKELAAITKDSLITEILPYSMSGARPACGMIKCSPTEPTVKINQKQFFEYEKSHHKSSKKENPVFSFQPAFETTLIKAKMMYQFSFDQLALIPQNKIFTANKPAVKHQNSIFVGIKVDNTVQTINGLSFFLGIKRTGSKANNLSDFDFIDHLKVFNNNVRIDLIKPIDPEFMYKFGSVKSFEYSHNIASMADLHLEAMNLFTDFFFQIATDENTNRPLNKTQYPDFFIEIFEDEVLKQFKEDLVWLEFNFDTALPELLSSVEIHINVIPVLNIRTVGVELDKEEPVKKLPMLDNEDFIGVTTMKLFDEYRILIETAQSTQVPFVLREMEMEKYGKRDLFELLEELINHYIADSYAFQEEYKIRPEDMNRLREVMKPLMTAKIKGQKVANQRNMYAIYNPGNNAQITALELSCSLTNGELANNISPGERLKTSNTSLDQNEISFITKTYNGHNRLNQLEKSNEVRRLLLSGNRIVSINDIKEFCYQQLGNRINSIKIEHSAHPHKDELRKCLMVNINLFDTETDAADLLILKRSLENKIKHKSNLIIPVIVNII